MKTRISGFSFVRNGFNYGCPFVEAIQSILPICDEFIVAVGDSTDGTREAIEGLNDPKIRIIDTVWDMASRKGGKTFAQQTNIALDACTGDWVFHIQADEVVHENDLPKIVAAIEKYDSDKRVEGFVFPFMHFWGDYQHVRDSRRKHRNEIRVFRNDKLIRSYRDSQGFRAYDSLEQYEQNEPGGKKLHVRKLDVPVFHYTGVRSQNLMYNKEKEFAYQYGFDAQVKAEPFNYHKVDRVKLYNGPHPKVMEAQIAAYDYKFEHDRSQATWAKKDKYIQPIEDLLGYRFGEYKNYILIK